MRTLSNLFGRSGLSDEQLAQHWAHLRRLYPATCNELDNPPIGIDVEESKRSTSFINTYLVQHVGLRSWKEQSATYLDLLDFYGRQRLADIMTIGYIERISDYGIVRNSLEVHPDRFRDEEKAALSRLLVTFEAQQPELVIASGWKPRPRKSSWLTRLFQ